MARDMLLLRAMTRRSTDQLARVRSQRRILAAGIRMRGQWRYLVRSLRDPFTLGAAEGESTERAPGATKIGAGRRGSVGKERI
jgi:hypothetical protein